MTTAGQDQSAAESADLSRALAYAVCGRTDVPAPAEGRFDSGRLADALVGWSTHRGGMDAVVARSRAIGRPWPHPVPAELMVGLSRAQFTAALAELVGRLGLDRTGPPQVGSDRALSPAERRLSADVPPHY